MVEVYYKKGKHWLYGPPVELTEENPKDMAVTISRLAKALKKPALDLDKWPVKKDEIDERD